MASGHTWLSFLSSTSKSRCTHSGHCLLLRCLKTSACPEAMAQKASAVVQLAIRALSITCLLYISNKHIVCSSNGELYSWRKNKEYSIIFFSTKVQLYHTSGLGKLPWRTWLNFREVLIGTSLCGASNLKRWDSSRLPGHRSLLPTAFMPFPHSPSSPF